MRFLFLLIILTFLFSCGRSRSTCDDGQYGVDVDLGSEENWVCSGKPFINSAFYVPAGQSEACHSSQDVGLPRCISETIEYEAHPPSFGPYRPLAPKYGDYRYLPPQRWLHTLKTGGVAFLYHPCADPDQIEELKRLARSCVEMHVVTPYAQLSKEKPFAVVTWGCALRLSWVRDGEVKKWLGERGVHYGVTMQQSDLIYDQGLRSYETSPLTALCGGIQDLDPSESPVQDKDASTSDTGDPGDASPTREEDSDEVSSSTKPTECPPSNGTASAAGGEACIHHTLKTLRNHHTALTVLVAMLGVILLGFFLILVVKLSSVCSRHRPRTQRYKSVSKYFPFSYEKQSTEVVIPAMGMPKGGAAERQVLLNDSDEDEL